MNKPVELPILPQCTPPSEQERKAMIEKAAYLRAEQRGFAPGHEIEDWLEAEKEIAHLLLGVAA